MSQHYSLEEKEMIEWTGKNRFQIRDTHFKCLGLGLGDPVSTLEEFDAEI